MCVHVHGKDIYVLIRVKSLLKSEGLPIKPRHSGVLCALFHLVFTTN